MVTACPGVRGIFMAGVCALDLGGAKTFLLREDRCDLLVFVSRLGHAFFGKTGVISLCVCLSRLACLLGVISLCVSLSLNHNFYGKTCVISLCVSLFCLDILISGGCVLEDTLVGLYWINKGR